MKVLSRVILMLVAATAGLFAIATLGYGTFGVFLALSPRGGGFVGEEGFYSSALFFVSLLMIAAGAAAAIISYVCWARWNRSRA